MLIVMKFQIVLWNIDVSSQDFSLDFLKFDIRSMEFPTFWKGSQEWIYKNNFRNTWLYSMLIETKFQTIISNMDVSIRLFSKNQKL